ncbi:MAG: recombination protein O N-terminal domain-containing protein, partial [Lachnospiraceae bacterium]|nr:recombination protein O N-terminal domain-containing protein [Lachnospiraceae bacterium]
MTDFIQVTGMILSVMPMGENDRRVQILTAEMGKISAFIRGGRKTGSPLLAAGRLFA